MGRSKPGKQCSRNVDNIFPVFREGHKNDPKAIKFYPPKRNALLTFIFLGPSAGVAVFASRTPGTELLC